MALNANGHRDAVTRIDDAGIFSGTDQYMRRLGGQATQVHARGLIGTVLAPHHAVEGQFERVRAATEHGFNVLEFGVRQAEGPMQGWRGATHTTKLSGDATVELVHHSSPGLVLPNAVAPRASRIDKGVILRLAPGIHCDCCVTDDICRTLADITVTI